MIQTQTTQKEQICPFVIEVSPRQETLQVSEQLKKTPGHEPQKGLTPRRTDRQITSQRYVYLKRKCSEVVSS
jgi:hypothetical protein